MSYREREHQKMLRMYQEETGVYDFNLSDVAEWAKTRGWKMPKPKSDVEILARQLQRAAREETRVDPDTGEEYRVNHSYDLMVQGKKKVLWFDFDGPAATVKKATKALMLRRNQALNDTVHIEIDKRHWNRSHGPDEQIEIDYDYNDEVQWRLAGDAAAETRKAG